MSSSNYDVVIVGAGAAGLTAGIGLARAGFAVVVVEAAAFPGAENWSGCVYFCENLAHPDILGPDGVEALAWERRLVERGFFATDGHGLLGMTYRDPAAFRHCYTVLRPIYDHHLAQFALKHGVALLTSTTAESLIRDRRRVVGVCTNRGPLYADLVFLAEGDASHLVTREGYEHSNDPREGPKFLQGIKEVIELPPRVIEQRFGVGPEEGVAYEMLLRNGTLRGRSVRLNMGGFLYTNRQSLSVGLVLPADNLHEHFDGDPNLLIEWFENLPPLQPWFREGKRTVFGAKIIRGGGAKDVPTLIDDGLAIGGAASAIGIDFPYPNFTGPATAMGLLITQAACHIREEGGCFTREELQRHYLEPLQRTHYWQDVEFLRNWPGYVKKTRAFFGRNLDVALNSAYLWTRSEQSFLQRWSGWLQMLRRLSAGPEWADLRRDVADLQHALQMKDVLPRPSLGRLLLDATLNTFRDLFRQHRAGLPAGGSVKLHYAIGGGVEPAGLPPASLRRLFERFAPAVAGAARLVYTNDAVPLARKLPAAFQLLLRQVSLFDFVQVLGLGLVAGASTIWQRLRGRKEDAASNGAHPLLGSYQQAVTRATDLSPTVQAAAPQWEARLGQLAYDTVKASHIHVRWPQTLPAKDEVGKAGLWHVCPAHVYEARTNAAGQVQVVVNFENCIKCETCWRTSDLVDWGRDGMHRFVYTVYSPVVGRLLAGMNEAGLVLPSPPRHLDWWASDTEQPSANGPGRQLRQPRPDEEQRSQEIGRLFTQLEAKFVEYDQALAKEPRTVNRDRAEFLEMLARYAHQLALLLRDQLAVVSGDDFAAQRLRELTDTLTTATDRRVQQTQLQHYTWAAAEGRQLRFHHLAGICRTLGQTHAALAPPSNATAPLRQWLQVEDNSARFADWLQERRTRLDETLPPAVWKELDQGGTLSAEQNTVFLGLLAELPRIDPENLRATLHPPQRKLLLAELGRRDPSLAYRAASHLWARDLATLAGVELQDAASRWATGGEWGCFALLAPTAASSGNAEALLVPARQARSLLLLHGDRLTLFPLGSPDGTEGLTVEPLATLGLRGAGLARVVVSEDARPTQVVSVDGERLRRAWDILSASDLISIASGMADLLCERAIGHATSRVQFPGLFHDDEARDTIGKFGAVKKMIAEMAARRYLLQTLDHACSPDDLSPASGRRAALFKAVAAEALGTSPGSVSYNAGQVFGGTGYSEDDLLSKYYRDAAAWRFLGPDNPAVYLAHGTGLLGQPPGTTRLSSHAGEQDRFEEIQQRRAIHTELQALLTWTQQAEVMINRGGTQAELAEAIGREDAYLLALKGCLLRTHARLERGIDCETEQGLLRVCLDLGRSVHQQLETAVARAQAPAPSALPLCAATAAAPVTRYADVIAAPGGYDSGDFLVKPSDLLSPRYFPDLIDTDPELAAYNRRLCELIQGHFGPRRNGLVYERYIEQNHRPNESDVEFLRQHGYFRMPIPRELGGEGSSKAQYYLLTTNTHRLADGAVSLTIQVNSSLGTTPVLLPREKDLPRAEKDLAGFVNDKALQAEIRDRLQQLGRDARAADAATVMQAFADLNKRLDEAVLSRPALRVLAHRFNLVWQEAGKAGKAYDLPATGARLDEALTHWQEACARGTEMLDEVRRRREAADLFLRWVAAGQISAFALTEPSAGSDTARVATRARLRSVPVEVEPDGVLRFVSAGSKEPRYLLDARRLEFREATTPDGRLVQVYYRWSELGEPALIHFDEYDYETDDLRKMRYYDHGGRRVYFTDIAQLRERDGRPWYDYWELTGAKMWITNGRMMGIVCLYAKTEEGVTGFIVDRHAEGLIVGKDEEKMGQCGSPTNELALQAVRVPRENVIGLEGRGQVNALETLNVGRAGLAMSAMSQMKRHIDWSCDFAQGRLADGDGTLPKWVRWRLQRMEEARFISEALSHDIIGRFEHKQTKSVRIESAIAKMLVSELLHEVIETAEDVHGLAGQTQEHLVEKRKRDARVLNIYEGTNEIQRFFILRDLGGELAVRWKKNPPQAVTPICPEAEELERLKAEVRRQTEAAVQFFGSQLWQNPSLQPSGFILAEAAAWVAAADSTLARLVWLCRRQEEDRDAVPAGLIRTGRAALDRCFTEVRQRLPRFAEELARLRRGHYAPSITAASLLFHAADEAPAPPPLPSRITRPLCVLVLLEPPVPGAPSPRVVGGELQEAYLVLRDADRSALETALRLRDEADAPVTVHVLVVGPRATGQHLRELLSLGIESVRLLVADQPVRPDRAAAAVADTLRSGTSFDLILGGAGEGEGEEGLLVELTAEALGVPFRDAAGSLAVAAEGRESLVRMIEAGQRQARARSLPAAVAVQPGLPLRPFTVEGYLCHATREVEVIPWPTVVEAAATRFVEGAASTTGPAEKPPQPLLPLDASRLVLEAVGLAPASAGTHRAATVAARRYEATDADTAEPFFGAAGNGPGVVLTMLAADAEGRLRPSARRAVEAGDFIATLLPAPAARVVLTVVPAAEEAQERLLDELQSFCPHDVCLLGLDNDDISDELRSEILADCLRGLDRFPVAVVGESWTELAFARLAARTEVLEPVLGRVKGLDRHQGKLLVELSRSRGKFRAQHILPVGQGPTCWLSLAGEVEVGAFTPPPPRDTALLQRWRPRLQRFYSRADVQELVRELKQASGVVRLADAEFILDVGFGVGNRDGYEAVIEPLEQALRELGVRDLAVGGSRKVTEELHLLPVDRQIGQSGVSVNPRILLAIGVSGAPQHLNYIGPRATIVAFNRDPEAPIMTLNQRQPRPRVFPVVGDLFETVPALIECLREETMMASA